MARPPAGSPETAIHIVVMGVSGSGKSTLAERLGTELHWPTAEADDFHPPASIAKMSQGVPLTDEDRWPWLWAIRDWMDAHTEGGSIVTCSALKRSYRDLLRESGGVVVFLHVTGPLELLAQRLAGRSDHFMPASLLSSQFDALEPLGPDEDGTTLVNDRSVDDLVRRAFDHVRPLTARKDPSA